MNRYFFHTADGTVDRDLEGTLLPNDNVARNMAVQYAARCLEDRPEILWDSGDFRVDVTDKDNETVFTMICVAVNGPKYWTIGREASAANGGPSSR